MSKKQVEEPKKPDIFLSTRNLGIFPDISDLKKICQSIAVISAYYQEYGFFEYKRLSNSLEIFFYWTDEIFFCVFFNDYGTIIIGFDHETEIWAKIVYSKLRTYLGLIDNVTVEFSSILEKFANSIPLDKEDVSAQYGFSCLDNAYRITYCIWRKYTDSKWNIGDIDFDSIIKSSGYKYSELEQNDYDTIDGSKQNLCILDGKPETFFWWYYEQYVDGKGLNIESVKYIYEHKPLTEEIFPKLKNPKVREKIKEIGYPIA